MEIKDWGSLGALWNPCIRVLGVMNSIGIISALAIVIKERMTQKAQHGDVHQPQQAPLPSKGAPQGPTVGTEVSGAFAARAALTFFASTPDA